MLSGQSLPRAKGALRRVLLKLVTLMSAPGRRRRCYVLLQIIF